MVTGDRLSIDYGNNFYHPVRTRQKHLHHGYDFVCLCAACTSGEDPFRAFCCPLCPSTSPSAGSGTGTGSSADNEEGDGLTGSSLGGVMTARYPRAVAGVSSGVMLETVTAGQDSEKEEDEEDEEEYQEVAGDDVYFVCTTCGYQTDVPTTQALLDAEDRLCMQPPETPEELAALLAPGGEGVEREAGRFHRQHYMCFWLMDDIAMTLALDGQEVNPKSAHSKAKMHSSISLVHQLLELLASNPGVPSPHHYSEEVIYRDRLAQLYVMVGETTAAQQQYQAAYDLSCVCAGMSAASTRELKVLVENTPSSAETLMVRTRQICHSLC